MCIIHKGFRCFRAVSLALILGGNLIGLKPEIPYELIHSPLGAIRMKNLIKEIWIESEDKGAIIGGKLETNDNSDIIVAFSNNTRFVATFFTYENIEHLRNNNKNTGECLNGKFFWASDMLIVDKINRKEIEEIINHLISESEFEYVFKKIEGN